MVKRRIFRRLLLFAAAVGVNLALADGVARWHGVADVGGSDFLNAELETPGSFVADPLLFWRLAPGNEKWRTSGRSTRGPCPDDAPGESRWRIVCVGDSCTFGAEVRYEQAWGVRLARTLDERLAPATAEPVLLACPGYSVFQSVRWYARERATLRPDVTIVCCGAWNDYVAAVGASDAARAASDEADRARAPLLRLARRAFGERPPDRAEVRARFGRGEAPFGRRVALDDFRAALRELVRLARLEGGAAVLVVPPLPAKTVREHPVALDYRAAVASVAEETGALRVDAAALFDRFVAGCPDGWSSAAERDVGHPLFRDWVHPSVLGHELLAAALSDALLAAPPPKLAALLAGASRPTHAEAEAPSAVVPAITVLREESLRLAPGTWSRGSRVASFWIGDHFIDRFRRLDDGGAIVELPPQLAAGRLAVWARGEDGRSRAGPPVDVVPLPLSAVVAARDGAKVRFAVSASGPPGFRLRVWGATALRPVAAATDAGPFVLAADPDGRPADRPELPFRFERIELPCLAGEFGADGRCAAELEVDADALSGVAAVHFQGLASKRKEMATSTLTAVATVALDR